MRRLNIIFLDIADSMILINKHQYDKYIRFDNTGQYVAHYKNMTLRSVFQPIFSREKRIVGVEALVRIYTNGHRQIRPDLFFYSDQYNQVDQINVELLSRSIHVRNFANSPFKNIRLFLNLLPSVGQYLVQNESFSCRLSNRINDLNLRRPQIVMEIVEQHSDDNELLREATQTLSNYGFHIAVDDYGSQASNSERVDLISPDIIKFDRTLLKKYMNGDTSPLLDAIKVAQNANAKTVVEGIETEQQFEAMKALNLNMYQGYFLGTPERVMPRVQLACG